MASSKTKSNGASMLAKNLQQSISPHRRSCNFSGITSSSSVNSSSTSIFSSPNRINLHRRSYISSSPTVRFSIDNRIASPDRRSVTSSSSKEKNQIVNGQKKTCMCSTTTHPGSFRCSFHRSISRSANTDDNNCNGAMSYRSHRLYARRSAMANSIVRIGTVEGDLLKRALASLIRPSSHWQKRHGDFQRKPSRLSVMSKAED